MGKNLLVWTVLSISLAFGGCTQNERREPQTVEEAVAAPTSTTVTLSPEQLMSLDWNGRAVDRSMILAKRMVDTGVELDIRFPGNSAGVCTVDHTSSGAAGRRALVGLDVGRYEAFALKFSLISVNAHCDPNIPLEVAAGAMIGPAGDGRYSACEPVVLGLSADQATGVATTPMQTQMVRVIGIHAHVVDPEVWDTAGGIVTLRVEPAPDADILPSPGAGSKGSARAGAARNSGDKSGTKSSPMSTFQTNRMGAW